MNKNKILLIAAAILLIAVVIVLVGVIGSNKPISIDADALYGNSFRQIKSDVQITLDKNGKKDFTWQAVTEENVPFTVTEKSNGRQGKFLISGSEAGDVGDVTFRLVGNKTERCIYELAVRVYIGYDLEVSVAAMGHTSFTEDVNGGEGTVLPFVCYGGDNGSLIVEVANGDGEKAWSFAADENVTVAMLQSEDESTGKFFISLAEEGEKKVKLCNIEKKTAISLLLSLDENGNACVKSHEVTEYTPETAAPVSFTAERVSFAELYGTFTLPKDAKEQVYKLETIKRGIDDEHTLACGMVDFTYKGEDWTYYVSKSATAEEFSARERAFCKTQSSDTISGTSVLFYIDEDGMVSAFWDKDGRAYAVFGENQDVKSMTEVLKEIFGA